MKIKITLEMLENLGVCKSGYDDFIRVTGGIYEAEWTLDEQLKLLKTDLRKWYYWAVRKNIIPMWSMVGVDLSDTNLNGADLTGVNLSEAYLACSDLSRSRLYTSYLYRINFSRANLYGVEFFKSYLEKANFFGANLTCADFTKANLTGANFIGSNLYCANFSCANLIDVDFYSADLNGANFSNVIINKHTRFPEDFDLSRLDKK